MFTFRIRPMFVLLGALAALILSSSPAHATNRCVGTHPSCPGGAVSYPGTGAGLDSALAATQAAVTNDTIYIGPGTYADNTDGFDITRNKETHIIGAGRTSTIVTTTANDETALTANFINCPVGACTVSQLGIQLLGNPTTTAGPNAALRLYNAFGDELAIAMPGNPGNGQAYIGGYDSWLLNSTISVGGPDEVAAASTSVVSNLQNVTISGSGAGTAVYNPTSGVAGTATLERVRISGFNRGISVSGGGTVTVSDSLIELGSLANARGIDIADVTTGTAALGLDADRITILGSGTNQRGINIEARQGVGSSNFVGTVTDSLIAATGTFSSDFVCWRATGHTATIGGTYNAFNPATNDFAVAPATPCTNTLANTLNTSPAAPLFVNAAAGDYRPAFGSPLIDAGDPATAPSILVTDLRGSTRKVDGNGDATSRVDIGAYEYQRAAPTGLDATAPATAVANTAVGFTGTAATDSDGDSLTYAWSFDDGGAATGLNAQHAFATAGTHSGTLTVTDASGLTATKSVSVSISAPPTTPAPTEPTPPTPATPTTDTTAPTLGAFTPAKKAFSRARNRGFSLVGASSKLPFVTGTTSEAGTATITLARLLPGGRVGTKCVTPRPSATARPCLKQVALRGSIAVTLAQSGTFRLTFGGKFRSTLLPAGAYVATVKVADAAGNVSATRTVRFMLA